MLVSEGMDRYDLIYQSSPDGRRTWLQAYRLKDGYHIFEVMATIASFVPPTEYYVIAKDPKEAIDRFRDTYTWLDIVDVKQCDTDTEAYICNDFYKHPVNII